MTMMVGYIVADAATGAILRHGTCEQQDLEVQARDGEIVRETDPAVPLDPHCQRLDLESETLDVVDWIPPQPLPDDELRTWGWDAGQRRWVAAPTELAVSLPVRAERNRRLAETDWIMQRAWEQGSAPPPAWVAYRQALRDLPEQPGFPAEVAWPEAPSDA